MTVADGVTSLRHNRVELALHHLRPPADAPDPACRPLLLLHGLGDRSPLDVPADIASWPGSIASLDFTGHGESTVPRGGGYTPEILLADADAALQALTVDDPARAITVLGRGLGAYIALQLAAARPANVHGTVLTDGPGLAGGPSGPTSIAVLPLVADGRAPDPYALVELTRDLRPIDYVMSFARLAIAESHLDEPIAVASVFRPEWLAAVADAAGVMDVDIDEALDTYAGP